jgi:hypothetical protein
MFQKTLKTIKKSKSSKWAFEIIRNVISDIQVVNDILKEAKHLTLLTIRKKFKVHFLKIII